MRPIIRMFVLAAVSASATAAFAFDRVTVNVPFNFETHGKTFPAGTYKVESAANHFFLTVSSKTDTKLSSTWIARPAEFGPRHCFAQWRSLIFLQPVEIKKPLSCLSH